MNKQLRFSDWTQFYYFSFRRKTRVDIKSNLAYVLHCLSAHLLNNKDRKVLQGSFHQEKAQKVWKSVMKII